MKLLLQRVARASIEVNGYVENRIGSGLVIFVGLRRGDTVAKARQLAAKVVKLALWPELGDLDSKWATNVSENGFEVLVVLQQSICATFPGSKPNEDAALPESAAKPIFQAFAEQLGKEYQEEMVVAASISNESRVDLTAECPGIFELDADAPAAAARQTTAGAMSLSVGGELEPEVEAVTRALKNAISLPRDRAVEEVSKAFRVFGMKRFRTNLAEADMAAADSFASAVEAAGALFNPRQQELINNWLGLSLSGQAAETIGEHDQNSARERPDWSGHAAPVTPGTTGGRWAAKGGGKGFKGKGNPVRSYGHGIISMEGAAQLHGMGGARGGQMARFSGQEILVDQALGSTTGIKRSVEEPAPRAKFQKGMPTLAPMTPGPKKTTNTDEL